MKKMAVIVGVFAMLGLSSCFTPALWDATNPRERVAIKCSDVAAATLNERGIEYDKDEKQGYLLVKKSAMRKLGDYTVRFLATPVTVTLDAATTVSVIAVAVLYMDFNKKVEQDPNYRIQLYP